MSVGNTVETKPALGSPLERAAELKHEGADHLGAQHAVVSAQRAQAPWQRADPVTDGDGGKNVLFEVHGGVGHAAAQTRWTKSPSLTGKSHKLRVAAAAAFQVQTAMFEPATTQVLLELAHDKLR